MRQKQKSDEIEKNLLLQEYRLIHQERIQMSREDQFQQFKKYYQHVLDEFQIIVQKELKIKQKRELEELRVRKIREETRNIIESYVLLLF